MLHGFIDHNYCQAQFAALRRVIGNHNKDRIQGDLGVFSIYSILKDIEFYQPELTREKFFSLRQVPYDIEQMKKKEIEYLASNSRINEGFFVVPPELSVEPTLNAHRAFDRISYKNEDTRTANDLISMVFFEKIRGLLSKANNILDYTDKCVAHSATPESRESAKLEPIPINDFWQMNRILSEIVNILGNIVTGSFYMSLPQESGNFFSNWDSPLLPPGNKQKLRDSYSVFRRETELWKVE